MSTSINELRQLSENEDSFVNSPNLLNIYSNWSKFDQSKLFLWFFTKCEYATEEQLLFCVTNYARFSPKWYQLLFTEYPNKRNFDLLIQGQSSRRLVVQAYGKCIRLFLKNIALPMSPQIRDTIIYMSEKGPTKNIRKTARKLVNTC